jgi:hypothetical protein
MDDTLKRTYLTRAEKKHLDTLIGLPLARFRTAIARQTPEALDRLQERIEVLIVKQRWALGSHGIERHRAPLELGLLERRRAEVRRRRERGPAPVQLHLVEPAAMPDVPAEAWEKRAA